MIFSMKRAISDKELFLVHIYNTEYNLSQSNKKVLVYQINLIKNISINL